VFEAADFRPCGRVGEYDAGWRTDGALGGALFGFVGGGGAGRSDAARGCRAGAVPGGPVLFRGVVRRDYGRIVQHSGEDECSGAVLGEQAFEQPDDGLAILAGEVRHDTHHHPLASTRGDALAPRLEGALQFAGGVEGDGVGHGGSWM
jgi:hypothetical protein